MSKPPVLDLGMLDQRDLNGPAASMRGFEGFAMLLECLGHVPPLLPAPELDELRRRICLPDDGAGLRGSPMTSAEAVCAARGGDLTGARGTAGPMAQAAEGGWA